MQETGVYPIIDSHVDLLYDMVHHHPDKPLQETPDAWVSLLRLARLLAEAGYPDSAVEDVMGGNWFRFFSDLLGS